MRFAAYGTEQGKGLAAARPRGGFFGLLDTDPAFPGSLDSLIAGGLSRLQAGGERLLRGSTVDLESVRVLPPLPHPGKIVCVGLNYVDHSIESGFVVPTYPTIFARFASSLIGHGGAIVRPEASRQLDYEGEMVAVIGKGGRHIPRERALDHIIGYSIFNDASIRD